jgi:DNA repair protein RadC
MLMLVGDWTHLCIGVRVLGPEDVGDQVVQALGALSQEVLVALLLGADHVVSRCHLVAVGARNTAGVAPAEVFGPAFVESADAILVAHNHPSGSTTPSPGDLHCSYQLIKAGRLLRLEILDHLVVTRTSWRSLRESTRLWGDMRY